MRKKTHFGLNFVLHFKMDSGTQIMCYLDRNIVRVFDVLVLESLSLSAKVHLSLFWVVLVNWKISV